MSNSYYSIVIPYLKKSKSISKCIELLKKNSQFSFELIEIIDSTDVYKAFNDGVEKSSSDIVILMNDDMFVSLGWDINFVKYTKDKNICTGYLIEPGVIPVSSKNIQIDFGSSVEEFEENSFNDWVAKNKNKFAEKIDGEKGWYMPISFDKNYWVPYPNDIKFPHPNDITLVDDILPSLNYTFSKVNSFVYHLQNYSKRI